MKTMKGKNLLVTSFVLFILFMMGLLVTPQRVQAAEKTREYVQFNAGIPLADNLVILKGKQITVYLSSGPTVTGIVKEVKNNLLHLEQITMKEFYDVVIRIDNIIAVEAQVRNSLTK